MGTDEALDAWIWEVTALIVFSLAVLFVYGLYMSGNASATVANQHVRDGISVQEAGYDYEFTDGEINGAAVYYSILENGGQYSYEIVTESGTAPVTSEMRSNAITGSSTELLSLIDFQKGYVEKRVRDEDGNIEKIVYTEAGLAEEMDGHEEDDS